MEGICPNCQRCQPMLSESIEKMFRRDLGLGPFTSFGVGGPAKYFLEATSFDLLERALRWAEDHSADTLILGDGTNVLIDDKGFDGLVVRNRLTGVSYAHDGRHVLVTAAAGEVWDRLVVESVQMNYAGIECLSGIPGSVGAAPVQNIGAYGQEVSDAIVSVEVLNRSTLQRTSLRHWECDFGYRTSRFRQHKGSFVVLSVSLCLSAGEEPTIRYSDVERYLADTRTSPSLQSVRDAVVAIRRRKGMMLDSEDPSSRSVGSFFTNPILSGDEFKRFRTRVAAAVNAQQSNQGVVNTSDGAAYFLSDRRDHEFDEGPNHRRVWQEFGVCEDTPTFVTSDSRVKLSAAWLVERAGFYKGYKKGRAGLSHKQVLAIVNLGGATSQELAALAEEVRSVVYQRFGVTLEPEAALVGVTLPPPSDVRRD